MPPRGNAGGAVVQGNGISYHNGPVMKGTVNIYFIWYGDWTQNPGAKAIFEDWAQHIGSSPYFNINTTYGDTTANVSGAVAYNPLTDSTTMSATTFGTSLSDSSIYSIVSSVLSSHALPTDTNGLYFVLTARGIAETSGFLSQYCGWHTYGTIGGSNIKYSFVGDAGNSSGCSVQFSNSPNADPSADAMISVMTHELEETATDPNLNAWYDSSGQENADKCAWTFGATYAAANGSTANMKLGTRDYLIQQNWLNANGGLCALSYVAAPDFSVAISPTSRTLPSTGGTASYTISSTPLNGFQGTVAYGPVTGYPAGSSASAVDANGAFTVTTPAGIAAASYTLSVLATSGALSHTATAALVVSPPPVPSFNLTISPSTQTVTRGQSKTFTVTVTPVNGFNSTVNLSVVGAKTGLTLTFSPTSISGGNGSSTLTAKTTSSAKKGNDAFTVTATYGTITKTVSGSIRIQ